VALSDITHGINRCENTNKYTQMIEGDTKQTT